MIMSFGMKPEAKPADWLYALPLRGFTDNLNNNTKKYIFLCICICIYRELVRNDSSHINSGKNEKSILVSLTFLSDYLC